MYSLIIADDEEIERNAFRLFVNKNLSSIKVVSDVDNGIELIERVSELKPDIIVVDINMPGLNGLNAIKILKEKGLSPKIIILTAHSQFDYAQEALSLGADDYILKPVKKETLIGTLENCIGKIEDEQERIYEQKRLEKIIGDITPIIETDFMLSLMLGDMSETSLRICLDILRISFSAGYIMTLSLQQKAAEQMDEVEKNLFIKKAMDYITIEMKNICNCIISPVISNKVSVLIFTVEDMDTFKFKVWSTEIAKLLLEKVKKEYGIAFNAGIGQLYNNMNLLSKSYKESVNALADKSIYGDIKHFGDLYGETNTKNPFLIYEGELLKCIFEDDDTHYKTVLMKIAEELNGLQNIDEMKNMVLGLMVSLDRLICENSMLPDHKISSIKSIFKEIMNTQNKFELKLWVERTLISIAELLHAERKIKINGLVKKAVDYISKNYMIDLSLEMVAEDIGISPYYLSRLFKQELHKNFIEYLTEVRIKQAFELIREGKSTIKEISERTGYSNLTYFYRVFKKNTGKTIGEVKKSFDYFSNDKR
jgi:two-component system response regulator YesN